MCEKYTRTFQQRNIRIKITCLLICPKKNTKVHYYAAPRPFYAHSIRYDEAIRKRKVYRSFSIVNEKKNKFESTHIEMSKTKVIIVSRCATEFAYH